MFESCIYCGLPLTNTRYDKMFVDSVGNSADRYDLYSMTSDGETIIMEDDGTKMVFEKAE